MCVSQVLTIVFVRVCTYVHTIIELCVALENLVFNITLKFKEEKTKKKFHA